MLSLSACRIENEIITSITRLSSLKFHLKNTFSSACRIEYEIITCKTRLSSVKFHIKNTFLVGPNRVRDYYL